MRHLGSRNALGEGAEDRSRLGISELVVVLIMRHVGGPGRVTQAGERDTEDPAPNRLTCSTHPIPSHHRRKVARGPFSIRRKETLAGGPTGPSGRMGQKWNRYPG